MKQKNISMCQGIWKSWEDFFRADWHIIIKKISSPFSYNNTKIIEWKDAQKDIRLKYV